MAPCIWVRNIHGFKSSRILIADRRPPSDDQRWGLRDAPANRGSSAFMLTFLYGILFYSLLNLGRRRWTMAAWFDKRQHAICSCARSNHECIRCYKQTRWIGIFNKHKWCLRADYLQLASWVTLLHKYTLWSRCQVLQSSPVLVNSRIGLTNGLLHCLRSCVTMSRLRDTLLPPQSYFFTSDTGAQCYYFIVLCRFSLINNWISRINV